MLIREYCEKDIESIKNLLVELQTYLMNIDKEHRIILADNYKEVYTKSMLTEIHNNDGIIYVAEIGDKIVGFIAGGIIKLDEESLTSYIDRPEGRITELCVSEDYRSQGIGEKLMYKMEEYLISKKCEAIRILVFSYNESAKKFYKNRGYKNRTEDLIKFI